MGIGAAYVPNLFVMRVLFSETRYLCAIQNRILYCLCECPSNSIMCSFITRILDDCPLFSGLVCSAGSMVCFCFCFYPRWSGIPILLWLGRKAIASMKKASIMIYDHHLYIKPFVYFFMNTKANLKFFGYRESNALATNLWNTFLSFLDLYWTRMWSFMRKISHRWPYKFLHI